MMQTSPQSKWNTIVVQRKKFNEIQHPINMTLAIIIILTTITSDNNYFKSRGSNKDTEQDTGLYTMPLRTLLDIPKGRFHIIVEPSLCMAFGSCETLAPKVFVLEKNKRINPKAKVVSETGADFDAILAAAQTCPTKAIRIIDRYTGEQIYP